MHSKGSGWLAHCEYLSKTYSPEDLERVKAALDEKDRQELFGKPILPISRLDLGAVMNYLVTADKLLGRGDLQLIRNSLVYKARKELSGVYKFFISLVSPYHIIKRTSTIWRTMYDEGDASFEQVRDKCMNLIVRNAPTEPRFHDFSVIAYAEEALRISGCKNPRGRVLKSIHQGDDHLLIQFTWD